MTPVFQEFLVERDEIGDCVRAATASILDLPLHDVPHFLRDYPLEEWYGAWEDFILSRGMEPVMIEGPWDKPPRLLGYTLASGPASRGSKHMVVLHDGELVHDPYPGGNGLLSCDRVWMVRRKV